MDLEDDALFWCEALAIAATDKALLVAIDGDKQVWIPRSVIDDKSEVYEVGDEGKLAIDFNFAEGKGLV